MENGLEDFKARFNTAKVHDDTYSTEDSIVHSGFWEKTKCDRLIAMGDVSDLKKLQTF